MNKSPYAGVVAIMFFFGSSGALSQESSATADDPTDASRRALEVVVVTAQRREETLQDAALAIDAIDESTLIRQGVESAADLGALSPSLGVASGGGPLASFFVRGVGSLNLNPLQDAGVAQYYDNVYLGRSSAAAGQGLYDMERVELLKGPQGTLYGRNATGGVLNYIPKKPVVGDSSGSIQGDFGNFGKVGLQGAVNIPVGDTVAFRFAGSYLDRDGISDDGTNDAEVWSLRGQVLFEPTDNLSVRIAADHTDVGGKGVAGDVVGTYNTNGFAGPLTVFTPSGLPKDSGPTSSGGNAVRGTILNAPAFAFYQPVSSDELFQDFTYTGVLAELNYQTDAGTLTIIPAYRESEQHYAYYGPGYGPSTTLEEQEQLTLEARFATESDGAFNGVFGAFYFDEEISFRGQFNQDFVSAIQSYDPKGDSWAVFAQGTLDVSDEFRISAGVRYTEDSKSVVSNFDHVYLLFCGGPFDANDPLGRPPFIGPDDFNLITPPDSFTAGCPGHPALPSTFDLQEYINSLVSTGQIPPGSTPNDGFYPIVSGIPGVLLDVGATDIPEATLSYGETTYRAGIEWDFGVDSLFYAGYERGYRAGGVDVSAAAPTYEPEFIDAFTIGTKNRLLDSTLQVNAEIFYWEFTDQQISYFADLNGAPSFLTANANSTIQGVDLDVLWAATDRTIIGAKVQYLDSTFDSLTLVSDPNGGRFGCPSQGVGANGFESFDCAGINSLFAPEFAVDLTLNHVFDLGRFELSGTADVSYRSEQETEFSLVPETTADAYTTLNLEATLTPYDGPWALTAYVRNVTDERYIRSSNLAGFGLLTTQYNLPQTYGVRLRMGF